MNRLHLANIYRGDTPKINVLVRPSRRSVVDGTLTCLRLGILAGSLIGLTLFSMIFIVHTVAL